jgi:hypothetical protein
MNLTFESALAAVLAHSVVLEHSQPLRDDGVNPESIRNDFSPNIQSRDVGAETEASLAATEKYSPRLGAIQRQQLEATLLGSPGDGTRGLLDIYFNNAAPTAAAADRAASTAQREQDIADVTRLGAGAVDAFRSANPQQKALMDALNASAMEGLSAGRNLPPGIRSAVEQNVRSAQAARGFGFGLNDAMTEALGTTDAAERYYQNNFQRAQQIAGLNQATTGDPFQLVTGRASGANAGMGLLGMGNQNALGTTGNIYGGASNILDWNANSQRDAAVASANNSAALASAGIQAAGSIGSSM